MITERTLDAATDFPARERYVATVAGLPLRTAAVYASLFVIAFWFYTTLWSSAPVMVPDSGSYLRAAQDLSDLRIDELQERAPGYPLLLLITHSSEAPNRLLFFTSLSLHFTSIWLLGTILYRFGLREMILILFASILLLPPYVEYAGYVLSENLTEAMLVAGFVSLVVGLLSNRLIWLLLAGLAIAYAALTRPAYQLLAVAIGGYVLMATFSWGWARSKRKEAVKTSTALVSASILLLGGYSYLNYRSLGYFGLTTPLLGINLTQKTSRVLERLPDEHSAIRETLIQARNLQAATSHSRTAYDYIFIAIPGLTRTTGFDKAALSDHLLRLNLLLIQKAPLEYLQEVVWAFGSYWFPSSGDLANMNSRYVQLLWAIINFLLIAGFLISLLLLIGAATYIKMCLRALPSSYLQFRGSTLEALQPQGFTYGLAAIIVLYTAAITCLVQVGTPRYRIPTDALIIFMFFLGTHLWWRLVTISRMLLCDGQTPSHESSDSVAASSVVVR